jgi:RNA polymerase-binding protein DksA
MPKRTVMDAKDLERFRSALVAKRQALLVEVGKVERDLHQIAEDREPEIEEAAQEQRSARVLARLDDRGVRELDEIGRALARLRGGTYGSCASCSGPIPRARLDAIPETAYCVGCAEEAERGRPIGSESAAVASSAPGMPPDYSLLSGSELEEAIREHLRENRRVDMEELRIVCRHGVVHLSGSVPSKGEHQIVLQTITDVMGLKDLDDRLQAEEMLWEHEDRNGAAGLSAVAPWEEPPGTEDVTEAQEDGMDFEAPIRPIPEEE